MADERARSSGGARGVLANLATAVLGRPRQSVDDPAAPRAASDRRELLAEAARRGNPEAFYHQWDEQLESSLAAAELANLLGELARQCREAGAWRDAADAYHHALRLDKSNKAWTRGYMRMRGLAPEWGFYSRDPRRVWELSDYPEAHNRGLVAPIRRVVHGWVPASARDTLVSFKLNGEIIADTRAANEVTLPDGNAYLRFSRNLKELLDYAGAGDTLSVEAGGATLTIINQGDRFTFRNKPSRAEELYAKLRDGCVFDRYGQVEPSRRQDYGWQAEMIKTYRRLRDDVDDILGLPVFPCYGTLLGAVRDQDFISYDNDFDTTYISTHSDPEAVRDEFKGLCRELVRRGYELKVMITHTWVTAPGCSGRIDLFFGWFNEYGLFDISYGYHGEAVGKSADFFRFRQERMGEFEVAVPENSEAIVEQLYGAGWRTPDPGFAHTSPSRKVDRRYQLPIDDVTELRGVG